MKLIALANHLYVALVDDEDYPLLSRYAWSLDRKGYVKTSAFGTTVKLHRMILNAPKDALVDHINMNKLDNRKENLRLCDNAFNQANTNKRETVNGKITSSQFKGVSWIKSVGKFRVKIKRKYIGTFTCEACAALKYNEEAIKEWGEFANLNSVEEDHNCEDFSTRRGG
jgi:hypothetical protein